MAIDVKAVFGYIPHAKTDGRFPAVPKGGNLVIQKVEIGNRGLGNIINCALGRFCNPLLPFNGGSEFLLFSVHCRSLFITLHDWPFWLAAKISSRLMSPGL